MLIKRRRSQNVESSTKGQERIYIPFLDLVWDIQLEIASFWDVQTLLKFSALSSSCHVIANQEILWHNLLHARWNESTHRYVFARMSANTPHPSLTPTNNRQQQTSLQQQQQIETSSQENEPQRKSKELFKVMLAEGPRWAIVGRRAPHIQTFYFGTKIVRSAEWISLGKLLFMNRMLYSSGQHYFELTLPALSACNANPYVRIGVILDNEDRDFGYNYDVDVNSIFIPKPPVIFDAHAGNIVVYNLLPTWCYTYTLVPFLSCTKHGAKIGIYLDSDKPLIAFYVQQSASSEEKVVNGTPTSTKRSVAETVICPLSEGLFRNSFMQGFRTFVEFNEVNATYSIETNFGAKIPPQLSNALQSVNRSVAIPKSSLRSPFSPPKAPS